MFSTTTTSLLHILNLHNYILRSTNWGQQWMRSAEHRQILQFYVRPRSTAICMARTTLLHNGNGTECFLMFKCLRRKKMGSLKFVQRQHMCQGLIRGSFGNPFHDLSRFGVTRPIPSKIMRIWNRVDHEISHDAIWIVFFGRSRYLCMGKRARIFVMCLTLPWPS